MSEPQRLMLGDSLDVTAAAPLVSDLRALRGQPLIVDASQVRRIGGQCLQVLISARASWTLDGRNFEIVQCSPEFAEGVSLMGCPDLAPAGPGSVSLVQEEIQ